MAGRAATTRPCRLSASSFPPVRICSAWSAGSGSVSDPPSARITCSSASSPTPGRPPLLRRRRHPGWISRPGRGPSVGRVGIIDTGFADFSATAESDRLDGIDRAPFSIDEPDADPVDGKLDWEAGHGTFIAGQIRHAQPDAEIVVIKGLDGFGTISEADLCHLMLIAARRGIDVLNLSLGGYALDDECPSGLSATLAQLVYRRDLVIVAAAGNKGSDRPFWPAASKHVVAVGAPQRGAGMAGLVHQLRSVGRRLRAGRRPHQLVLRLRWWAGRGSAVRRGGGLRISGRPGAGPPSPPLSSPPRSAPFGPSSSWRERPSASGTPPSGSLARGIRTVSGLGTEFDVDTAALPWP